MILKLLSNEIKNNKDLEVNLPKFMNEMSSVLAAYAGTNFVMHYYDLYENFVDQPDTFHESVNQLVMEINKVVKETLLQSFDGDVRESSIKKLHAIREEIMKSMRVLTAYTDIFSLYEYVINRMELNFEDQYEAIDNDLVAKEIFSYIFNEKDNVIVNSRIKQMLSQLPVRMTKAKFFDLLQNALTFYEGGDRTSLDNFLYMIRSASGLEEPQGMDTCFPVLKEYRDSIAVLEADSVDEKSFYEYQKVLEKATNFLVLTTNTYYSLQEIVNHLYAFLLNQPYASEAVISEFNKISEIVASVNEGFLNGSVQSVPEHIVALFEQTEGKLEQTAMEVQTLQGILDIVSANHIALLNPLMLESYYQCLVLSSKLISDSIFIELNESKGDKTKVQKEDLKQAFETLSENLSTRLESQGKMLNRAMIAAVLRELPVFFDNQADVMNYIKNSLASCRNSSEKVISIRLMKELMEESK